MEKEELAEEVNEDENETNNVEERSKDETSIEEWTIIGHKDSNVHQNNKNDQAKPNVDNCEAAEEVLEAQDVNDQIVKPKVTSRIEEVEDDKNNTMDNLAPRDEDSDVSFIADSEEPMGIGIYKPDESLSKDISKATNPADSIYPPALIHIIIACSLATAVGFGIGFFVGPRNTQLPSSQSPTKDLNYYKSHDFNRKMIRPHSVNDENDNDVNYVNSLDTIDDDNSDVTVDSLSVLEDDNVHVYKQRNTANDNNLNSIPSLRKIIDKIQFSLDTLCILINDTQKLQNRNNICNENIPFFDVIKLKDDVKDIIYETGFTEEVSNKRFIEKMDLRIRNISLSFFSELPNAVKSSLIQVDRRMNKVRRKLLEKLCLLQNTIGHDPKFEAVLKKRDISLEKCAKLSQKFDKHKQEQKQRPEKEFKRPEKIYERPVGPELNFHKEKNGFKEHKGKDSWKDKQTVNDDKKKTYKNEKKSKKRDSKYDEEPQKYHQKQKKYLKEDERKFCEGKSCKQRSNDRKSSPEMNEDWQFKRSDGRNKWRMKGQAIDDDADDYSLWESNRAKLREQARQQF